MKQKLSQIPAPALAGGIREKTVRGAIAEIQNCVYSGADMIDLHLSCLENSDVESLRGIIEASGRPVLALNYNNTYEWGDAGLTEEERTASLLRAVEAGAAGVDMQGYTFHRPSLTGYCGDADYSFTKGNPKEVVTDEAVIARQCEFIDRVHAMGAEVLLSCHPGIHMSCEQVVELALYLEKRDPDIIKIVTTAFCEEDLAECLKTMVILKKEIKTPISFHANGKAGMLSRIVNPMLGGQILFGVGQYKENTTMEQIDLRTASAIIDNVRKLV